jgi:hypothetical protein
MRRAVFDVFVSLVRYLKGDMILVWDDARSFQRHLEDMGRFRRLHEGPGAESASFHDMPAVFDIEATDHPGRADTALFTMVRGCPVVVPIWKIALPVCSYN